MLSQHLELHCNPVLSPVPILPAVPCCHGNREADSAAKEVGPASRLVAMETRKGGGASAFNSGALLSDTPPSSLFLSPGMERLLPTFIHLSLPSLNTDYA